ncbi:hypothetical protein AB2M62_17465 [Sphingomonas sp. MMS12-HWE2-04]|uniref:hypothetical protein n=1 Tax=Sphingomonas sp. MMS12-HWE2-04 TaxID=3234199 RepID=UPI00384FB8C3
MSDEPFAAPQPDSAPRRTGYLVGGIAFIGGVAVTAAAFQLAGGLHSAPNLSPLPLNVQPVQLPAPPPGTDLATLNARESELAARLDQLALRLRDVDGGARTASLYASRAERLLIAASVRRAIERGQPLGPLEPQLRLRFAESNPDAVGAILNAAGQPVTLEDLRLALETIAPRLRTNPDDSLWARARRLLSDLVVLRQADSPSPRTSDRIRRARRALNQGDVEAALAEVAHMPGAPSAESWISAAKRYIAARQGLAEIESAALQQPAAPPTAAAPAAPAPEPAPAD